MFEQRSAIITGAASPIGSAIARRLKSDGANLMLADLEAEAVAALADELDAIFVAGDLSDEDRVRSMVERTHTELGSVDILVNNAGGGVIRPFLEHDAASLKATIDRNLWTTLWACHACLPYMIDARYGRIVNIGADSVRNGLWDHAGYNAAKGGVHGLTTGIAREFAETGVTINTVAPCMVATPVVNAAAAKGSGKAWAAADHGGHPRRRGPGRQGQADRRVHLPEAGGGHDAPGVQPHAGVPAASQTPHGRWSGRVRRAQRRVSAASAACARTRPTA